MTKAQRQSAKDQIFADEWNLQDEHELKDVLERCTDEQLAQWMYDLGWMFDGEEWFQFEAQP